MFARPRHHHRGPSGMALIIVLWMVVLLSLMVFALLSRAGAETRVTATRKKMMRAEAFARAGMGRAVTDLRNDLIMDLAEEGEAFDALGDVWNIAEEDERFFKEITEDRGTVAVEVEDLDGLLDLNRMGANSRPVLEAMLKHRGLEEDPAKIVAAAIIDWIDFDTNPIDSQNADEDEGIYYARLMAEAAGNRRIRNEDLEPIRMANEPMQTVEGLLSVYGVTAELFFGPETEEAADYERRHGRPTWADEFPLKEKRTRRDDEVLGLRDYFTTYNSGVLNLNTAPTHVLAAFFEAGGATDGERVAETYVRRSRGNERSPSNRNALKSMADVSADGDLAGYVQTTGGIYRSDVKSNFFRVTCTGEFDGVRKVITADLFRQELTLLRDESFEASDRARERQKILGKRTDRRQDKSNESLVRYPSVRIIRWIE